MQDPPLSLSRRNFGSGKWNPHLSFELKIGTYNLSTNLILPSSHFFSREPHTQSNEKTLKLIHIWEQTCRAYLSIWDAKCLEICQRQCMNQIREKSPKPLGKKKKKVSQWYDTKIFADCSVISLNKDEKPFFHLDHTLEVEVYISSQSQLKSMELKLIILCTLPYQSSVILLIHYSQVLLFWQY